MKKIFHFIVLMLLSATAFLSCTDDTGNLGIYPSQDGVSTAKDSYHIFSRSVEMGAVVANNSNGYLGCVVDPETGGIITAECAAQFHCFEDYSLPRKELMVGDITINPATGDTTSIEYGKVKCDSCEVRIYLNSFYGDGNNPMKLEVYELDDKKIMEENETYQTNVDLTQYVKKEAAPIATKVFTPIDYIIPEGELTSSSHSDNIRIMLPASFGQHILEKYYENPANFKDSYHFIRNVFPGFYFRISNGEGTMITTQVSTINIYYNYRDQQNKKIYAAMTRFSATPEVIQSTRITNSHVDKLVNDTECTYLKTPAGICTEMTLPVDEVFSRHPGDSISQAQFTLTRYNKITQDKYQLGTPSSLLMVRKQHANEFFEKNEVANGRTSYVTSFNTAYNTYTFYNLARLLSYCKHEKTEGAKKLGISEAEWEAKNPDWNKILLIPVVTSTNSSGILTSVSHDMQMNSIRLVGGKTPISLEVTYSKYSK